MTWHKTRADRQRDQAVYASPEYRRNRELARRRANGRCAECHHLHARLECDHIINAAAGGGHELANLRMLCKGPGTCRCHDRKTAAEGGGFRRPADPEPARRTRW